MNIGSVWAGPGGHDLSIEGARFERVLSVPAKSWREELEKTRRLLSDTGLKKEDIIRFEGGGRYSFDSTGGLTLRASALRGLQKKRVSGVKEYYASDPDLENWLAHGGIVFKSGGGVALKPDNEVMRAGRKFGKDFDIERFPYAEVLGTGSPPGDYDLDLEIGVDTEGDGWADTVVKTAVVRRGTPVEPEKLSERLKKRFGYPGKPRYRALWAVFEMKKTKGAARDNGASYTIKGLDFFHVVPSFVNNGTVTRPASVKVDGKVVRDGVRLKPGFHEIKAGDGAYRGRGMTTGKKIVLNCASILTGNFINKAITIAVLMALTAYLSPAEFGRYSFVIAYTSFFGIFTELGINTLLTREISAGTIDAGVGFGHAILIRTALTVTTAAVSVGSLALLGYPSDVVTLAAASSISLFISFRGLFLRTVFDIPFQVNLKMAYPSAVNLLNEVITLGVVIWLVRNGTGLLWLVISINLANIPGFIAVMVLSARVVRPRFRIDAAVWKAIVTRALPLGAASLLEGVFIITPFFVMSRFSTEDAIGFYSLPFRLVSSLWIIPVAVMVTLLPRMSRDANESRGFAAPGFFKGFKLVVAAGLPIGFITFGVAPQLINLFTHGRYGGSVAALTVMIWGTVLYFLNTVYYYSFTAAGRQGNNTAVWAVVSTVAVAACLVLVPRYHHMGAAWGYVTAMGAGFLCNIFLGRRVLGINPLPAIGRFVPGAIAFAAVIYLAGAYPAAGVPIGVVLYAALLAATKAVSLREWWEWLERETDGAPAPLKTAGGKGD